MKNTAETGDGRFPDDEVDLCGACALRNVRNIAFEIDGFPFGAHTLDRDSVGIEFN